MDVQAASTSVVTSGTVPPAEVATPAAISQAPTQPAATSAPAPSQPQQPQQNSHQTTLAPAIAKLFGSGSSPQPISLNVSYRILKGDLGEIVTVFTDPKSGKEVAQFPPEILIGLASFFDQESGVTLDTNA